VGHAVHALDVLADQLDLAEALGLVTAVEVGKGHLEHTALQGVRGDLCKKVDEREKALQNCLNGNTTKTTKLTLSGSSVHNGLSGVAHGEHGRGLDGVQLLLGERVLPAVS
jgi:hypothetical protein